MSPVTIPAVEWFFGQRCAKAEACKGTWIVKVLPSSGEGYSGIGLDPIELIEAAYEELYAEPARREIREEEK